MHRRFAYILVGFLYHCILFLMMIEFYINSISISAIHVKTIALHHISTHITLWNETWKIANTNYLFLTRCISCSFFPICISSEYGEGSHFSSLSEYFNWIKRASALWYSYINENMKGRIYKFNRKKIENANGIWESTQKDFRLDIFRSQTPTLYPSVTITIVLCRAVFFLWVATSIWNL